VSVRDFTHHLQLLHITHAQAADEQVQFEPDPLPLRQFAFQPVRCHSGHFFAGWQSVRQPVKYRAFQFHNHHPVQGAQTAAHLILRLIPMTQLCKEAHPEIGRGHQEKLTGFLRFFGEQASDLIPK
jgi:hypothetical protein